MSGMLPHYNSLTLALDQVSDGAYIVDRFRRILYWNPAAERIAGYTREQMVGRFCMDNILMHVNECGELLCRAACPLIATISEGAVNKTQVYLHHADGHRVSVHVRTVPMYDGEQICGAIEIFSENLTLSAAMEQIAALQRDMMIEPLTGMGSRQVAHRRLEIAFQKWQDHQATFGVLFADIDHFKQVNDQFGHSTGDEVLRMVSRSILNGLRPLDFAARWGGEEFLILVHDVSPSELKSIAERLRMLVEFSHMDLPSNSEVKHPPVQVRVSMGAAWCGDADSVDSLLETADRRLYQSKAAGRNRVTI